MISISEVAAEDLSRILNYSAEIEEKFQNKGIIDPIIFGSKILLVFDEPSFRTRAAFEVAITDLGGDVFYYDGKSARLTKSDYLNENYDDLGAMMSGFYDAVVIRVYNNQVIKSIASSISIPIINAMCDINHPTQALCDIYTIEKHKGSVEDLSIVFLGDFTNISRSIGELVHKLGGVMKLSCPIGVYEKDCDIKDRISYFENPYEAVEEADVVITDVWAPMNSARSEEYLNKFYPYQVNSDLVRRARNDYIFLHNLPASRGREVTAEVIDGPNSLVHLEGVYRKIIARGLMKYYLC